MFGNANQTVFVKCAELAQTTVQIAAERGAPFACVNRAVEPPLHKDRCHAVADFEFRDRFADFRNFARTVGKTARAAFLVSDYTDL